MKRKLRLKKWVVDFLILGSLYGTIIIGTLLYAARMSQLG